MPATYPPGSRADDENVVVEASHDDSSVKAVKVSGEREQRVFQHVRQLPEKCGAYRAVDDPMIAGKGDAHPLPDDDRVVLRTTASLRTAPTARMADPGGLMMAVNSSIPDAPDC